MIISPETFKTRAIGHNLIEPVDVSGLTIYTGSTDGYPSIWLILGDVVYVKFLYKNEDDLSAERCELEKIIYKS